MAGNAFAQQTEVITLKHRAASDVIGVIRPLVEPKGSVSAEQDKLIVHTTAANMVQVKKVVAAIDREPRRLVVSVRQDGTTASGGNVYSTKSLDSNRTMQQVQVLEGGRAFIETGSSMPVSNPGIIATPRGAVASDNVQFRDLKTGFFVSPKLVGDKVTLDLSTRRDTPANVGAGQGSADLQAVSTTVSGRLGEWIDVGGTGHTGESDGSQSWHTSSGERRVQLKVEELH